LTKRRAQPVTGIRQRTADAQVGCDHAINLGERDLRLGACRSTFERNVRPLKPRLIARPTLGKKEAQTPESPALHHVRASMTKVWQLAFLPSATTPTECLPFFGAVVSSITSTASLPPTSLST